MKGECERMSGSVSFNKSRVETVIDAMAVSDGRARIVIDAGLHGNRVEIRHADLFELGLRVASRLIEVGCEPGDRVAVALPTSLSLLAAIVGIWQAGVIPVVLPKTGGKGEGIATLQRNILKVAKPRVVIAEDQFGEVLVQASHEVGVSILLGSDLIKSPGRQSLLPQTPCATDISLLQFSSGSTGFPRGCVVRHGQMARNMLSIMKRAREGLNTYSDDRMLSWAPFNHDMGFNAFSFALMFGLDLVLIPTESFSRSPYLWLSRISETQATLSPAPSFAYRLLMNIQHARQLSSIDLSVWRYAWMGAEPVYPDHIRGFFSAFSGRGLAPTTLRPNYGLAETVVVASMLPAMSDVSIIDVDKDSLLRNGDVQAPRDGQGGGLSLVGCGYPVDGVEIAITDQDGRSIGEDRQGAIFVRGSCVIENYWNEPSCLREGGWLDTGDVGFLHQGQIYISSRAKDVIIRSGKNYAANDIERLIENCGAEREQRIIKRVAVFSVLYGASQKKENGEEIVAVVESKSGRGDVFSLERAIRDHVFLDMGLSIDRIVIVPPGSIPLTTSGKVQRNVVREMYLSDRLAVK
ncbi:putative AMP-binding protein [Azospirillaceae bacterium]